MPGFFRRRRRCPVFALAGLALAGVFGCARLAAAEIVVFAAASLSEALRELAALHEKAAGDTVRLNLGASSTLARQIREGAPADLFFSADEAKMDDLAAAGLIEPATRRRLLSNSLVVVVAADSTLRLGSARALTRPLVRRLAVAEPETVPAGVYARAYLQQEGLWEQLAGKTVPVENVRAVLAAVASGNADAGIVYKTDALVSRQVRIVLEAPPGRGPRISYPLALIKGSVNSEAAARFAALLTSPTGKSVFVRQGFLLAP